MKASTSAKMERAAETYPSCFVLFFRFFSFVGQEKKPRRPFCERRST